MPDKTIDVIIPVYRPGEELRELLIRLTKQTVKPSKILLMNTEKEFFDENLIEGIEDITVVHIRKKDFDHGGTRHIAAEMADGDFLLFMTQDAMPQDAFLVENLVKPFADGQVCASYARQLPAKDCNTIERYTRKFNYGQESRIKTSEDLPELGIKTYFCSNVCAMYRRSVYEELGGFERRTIFNEDMIFAGKLVQSGRAIAYCADAKVIHSHNYTCIQQFRRNFDLGVSQAEHPEIFSGVPSEGEGIRMVKKTAAYLLEQKKIYLIPKLVLLSGCKFVGYRLGKGYKKLPKWLIDVCTMNKEYWR